MSLIIVHIYSILYVLVSCVYMYTYKQSYTASMTFALAESR